MRDSPCTACLLYNTLVGVLSVDRELRARARMEDAGTHVRMLGCDTRHGACIVSADKGKIIEKANVDEWCQSVFRSSVLKKQSPQHRECVDDDVKMDETTSSNNTDEKHSDVGGEMHTHTNGNTSPHTNGKTNSRVEKFTEVVTEVMKNLEKKVDWLSTNMSKKVNETDETTSPSDDVVPPHDTTPMDVVPTNTHTFTKKRRHEQEEHPRRVSMRSNESVPPAMLGTHCGVYTLMVCGVIWPITSLRIEDWGIMARRHPQWTVSCVANN